MAEAIYSERACALKTPHEDHSISTTRIDIFAECTERPHDGNGPSATVTMDAADQELLAALLFAADAADGAAMPVEAAEDLLRRLSAPSAHLVAIADSEMIGVLVDRQISAMPIDRAASSGPGPQQG